jgi:metal-responsive CopG/Arc/MetJ family transcriptional regulator
MTTLINFKVPDKLMNLIEQVDAYAATNDTSRSQFIRQAIADKLEMEFKKHERECR